MNDLDLPEPKLRVYTEAEIVARKWQLWRTVVLFVASYSLLHKLIIPVILKFTVLKSSPYSYVDPMFIFLFVVIYCFSKSKSMGVFLSFLAGVGISHGVFEVVDVLQGKALGWLAISHLLSSLPLAIACGYLMTQRKLGRQLKSAWIGALLYSVISFPLLLLAQGGRR